MAAPALPGWQTQILSGVGAPHTPQNLSVLNAWAQAEGGGATNNPFNTTQPVPGATNYNSVGVRNYATPQQGIQATIGTLLNGNYGEIIAAMKQGSDPHAVAQAIGASPWGTSGDLISQVLGGQPQAPTPAPSLTPPGSSPPSFAPAALPPAPVATVPRASVPTPAQLGTPDYSQTILSAIGGGGGMGALTSALIAKGLSASEAALSTPVQQQQHPVRTATTPNGNTVEVQGRVKPSDLAAVHLAESFVDKTPYVWGGTSPSGFDCSGLIQYVWAQQGVSIPRTTYAQFQSGTPVAKRNLQPGDALYFTGSDPQNGLPGHVGMYVGGGKFVEAPHTGADVRISNLSGRSDFVGARRFA